MTVVEKPEQLKQLLQTFLESVPMSEAMDDIELGMKCVGTHPAPLPGSDTIEAIKSTIRKRIRIHRTRTLASRIGWMSSVAAVLVAGVFFLRGYWSPPSIEPEPVAVTVNPPSVWKIDSDPILSGLRSDLEEVLDETLSVSPDQYYIDSPTTIEQIEKELQLMASNEDFWKG
jgi:hypothetical protein